MTHMPSSFASSTPLLDSLVSPTAAVIIHNDTILEEEEATTSAGGDATVTPPPPLPTAAASSNGLCPVKPQYLRFSRTTRVLHDADGKSRGMVKGCNREHSNVEGTIRPTFEGELNFLSGDVLWNVKTALRHATGKRPRETFNNSNSNTTTTTDAVPATTPTATSEEAKNDEQMNTAVEGAVTVPDAEIAMVATSEVDGGLQQQPEAPSVDADSVQVSADVPLVTPAAVRREAAASEREIYVTSAETRRQHRAQRDTLFKNRTYLAPLTTVGNLPYRRICAEYGADVTLGEMALIYNLNHTQKSEWSLLRRHESEKLFGLQVAVSRPADALVFAQMIEASGFSYDYIDINCGCPVEKLVQSGCGCGLWEKKSRLREVVANLTKYQSKPVTIKCRIGADEDKPTLHNQIGEYESWGASAVTIHGRSRKQRYTKLANWQYINQCAGLTALPVIGNGDIMSYDDIVERRAQCPNVSSHMLGRGALIKPWVFEEIRTGVTLDPSSSERMDMLQKFVRYGLAHWGADEKGIMTTRRFLCEWLSFLCRYVPVGLLERLPQRINERPPQYDGRDDLETLMSSDSVTDWIKISEMLLGPAGDKFKFTPKHRSNAYSNAAASSSSDANDAAAAGEDEG